MKYYFLFALVCLAACGTSPSSQKQIAASDSSSVMDIQNTPQDTEDGTTAANDSEHSEAAEQAENPEDPFNDTLTTIDEKRKLRYVYYANGGVVGYFNDGTVSACPRCDFTKDAVAFLYKRKPHGTYKIGKNCLIETYNGTSETDPFTPREEDATWGWAMVDYKWWEEPGNP